MMRQRLLWMLGYALLLAAVIWLGLAAIVWLALAVAERHAH